MTTKETSNMETKETKQPKKQNARIMELTPNWQSFFELAKQMTAEKIPEGEGRGFIIEMLDYGQQLDRQSDQAAKESEERNKYLDENQAEFWDARKLND